MPRVLLASYHFPPDAAVGSLRAAKFARTLPQFGWEPFALTARDELRDQGFDASRLAGLERVPIVRTGELPRVVERAIQAIGKLRGKGAQPAGTPQRDGAPSAPAASRETFKAKLTRWAVSLLVLLPDEKKNWAGLASVVAVRLIRRNRIDWVITSGPPFSVHLIGLTARLLTRAKWGADFRDPWIDMLPDRFPNTRSALSDRLERWMEAAVVRVADRVFTTTERMRQAMAARYPGVPAAKFVCVPNSIERANETSTPVEKVEKYDRLTITYAGVLYFDRTPEPLFKAVGDLLASGRARPADLRIKLVGQCRQVDGIETMTLAARYGLDDVVEVIDRVPHAEAVRLMQRSHLLLMLAPARHRLVIPAKIFDYLGSGSSVLTIAEPGATSDLIAETQCGRCFSATDTRGLADYLAELLEDGRFRQLGNDPAAFARYHVRHLTEQLVLEMEKPDVTPLRGAMART